jgi:hypothetical protein
VVDGNMIGGFALVAFPAEYGNSGIMTFMVDHDSTVFQKILARHSRARAQNRVIRSRSDLGKS